MNAERELAAQRREHPEPQEQTQPIPRLMLSLVALLILFCAGYILWGTTNTPSAWGDGRSVAELQGTPRTGGAAAAVDGAAVYTSRCAACHQATGAGLPGAFPPLARSEWVKGKDTVLAALVLHGLSGPITVNGVEYTGAMPAFKDQLQDAEIAAVLTHIRAQWGNAAAAVTPDTVAAVRRDTAARRDPIQGGSELAKLP